MKKRLLSGLFAVLLVLLAACSDTSQSNDEHHPTLPDFSTEQTPLEQLRRAVTALEDADSYTMEYGTVRTCGEETAENRFTQYVTSQRLLDRDAMYAAAPLLPGNEDFLAKFCASPLRVIPSNTGVLSYQLTDLDWETAEDLLAPRSCPEDFSQAVCAVTMDVDGEGRLCRFRIDFETETQSYCVFLTITFPENS